MTEERSFFSYAKKTRLSSIESQPQKVVIVVVFVVAVVVGVLVVVYVVGLFVVVGVVVVIIIFRH